VAIVAMCSISPTISKVIHRILGDKLVVGKSS